MTTKETIYKTPGDNKACTFDFSAELGDDEIAGTPDITAATGITVTSETNDTTTVTAFFAGGEGGEDYAIYCEVVTVGGETIKRRRTLAVRDDLL